MEEVTQTASIPTTIDDFGSEGKGVDANETKKEEGERVAEEEDARENSSDLQQLMQNLEAKVESPSEPGQSLGWIVVVVDGIHTRIYYRLLDTAADSYKSWKECRVLLGAQAKLRLLQAIGSCMTLRRIEVKDLTGNELEALLTPMQSNPVLEYLRIHSANSSPAETASAAIECTERICEILRRILQTSRTFNNLRLFLWGVTAAGACHLASGVRGNAESALEILRIGKWEESSVATQVADIVMSAPRLRELHVDEGGVIEDDGIDALANALASSTSLKRLWLDGVVRGASALLRKAFTGDGSNKSIATLRLTGVMEGIGDSLPRLLSANQSLKELVCDFVRESPLSPSQWQSVGQALSSSSSLELFRIRVPWSSFRGEAIDGGEALLSALDLKSSCVGLYLNSDNTDTRTRPWWSQSEWKDEETKELLREVSTKNLIIELHLVLGHLEDITTVWASLAEALNNQGTQLSSLYLQMSPLLRRAKGREVDNFLQALRTSFTVRLLTIDGGSGDYWPAGWTQLIDCLRSNISITHLRLIKCNDLDDHVFKLFMGILHVNLTLKRIRLHGTSWERDGKEALIQEALRRNAGQDSYFSTFRRHGLPFQRATNGRLFLCGSPLAGKTKLRQTMARILRGSGWIGDKFAQLWRTKCVEVELLKDDEEMQIAVWDLAGQWIFRALQDILFPRTNHTSIFLFVFSPYDRENSNMKANPEQCLKEELEEWLRFIASNSQITGGMLPKVLVVISHMDKMEDRSVSWANSVVEELGEEFEETLDVCRNLYQVNACRKKDVIPLKDFIFDSFRDLLRDKTPIAPRACSQISSVLAKRTENIKHRPIWPSKDFYSFCFTNLQAVVDQSLRPETPKGLEVFKAMAAHLHDTGSIIIISGSSPDQDRIIVDPNWLTNVFWGELITMGHNFQVTSSAIKKSKLVSSRDGFVSSHDLDSLLSSFLRNHPEFQDLDINILEELLIHFDLCYKLDSKEVNARYRYYIPAIVCEDSSFQGLGTGKRRSTGSKRLSWSSPRENNQPFIGFRVECENPRRMSMTAALYPRFHIYMRQKLMTEMNLTADTVMCFRNYMRLHMDGHEILVERGDMAKSHVDVMVKCSKNKPRETVVKYIQEHIIDELIAFCASPKGCPGVSLVVGVLRTKCVEQLVPLASRGDNQGIQIRKLKENFEAYIKKQVKKSEMKIESSCESSSSLMNYEHYWPPIPPYLPSNYELAKELLPESEMESVTKNVLVKHEQQLKLLDQLCEEMAEEMEQIPCVSEVVVEVDKSSIHIELGDMCLSSQHTSSRPYVSQPTFKRALDHLEHQMVDLVGGLEHKMEERFDGLEATLRRIETNVNKIITLQPQLQSSVTTFMSKLDKMIGYAESWDASRTPKRPYFNFDNISVFHKVTAKLCLGTPVRLHLMCESVDGHHIVKHQPGLKLYLEKENMEWLRTIYHISSRMLYYLGKSALHVTLGLEDVVSELGTLKATLPLLVANGVVENIKIDTSMLSLGKLSGNIPMSEAWNYLRSSLEPHLQNRYTELFKLHRVKYLNLEEERFAWVCDQCMTRGNRSGSLECI